MSKEIEIKVIGISKNALVRRLKEAGYKKEFSGLIVCRHFDFPDKRLRKAGKLVRVRSMGKERVEFTYKGPKEKKGTCKIRPEIQTYVEDGDVAGAIIKEMGLKETLYCEKKRTSYLKGKVHVDLDYYPEDIFYAEIEAPTEKLVHKAIKELRLGDFEISSETANALFKRKWPKIKLNGLRF